MPFADDARRAGETPLCPQPERARRAHDPPVPLWLVVPCCSTPPAPGYSAFSAAASPVQGTRRGADCSSTPSVTFISCGFPALVTRTVTVFPTPVVLAIHWSSFPRETSLPSKAVTRSPTLMPALSAGPPPKTYSTTAPLSPVMLSSF